VVVANVDAWWAFGDRMATDRQPLAEWLLLIVDVRPVDDQQSSSDYLQPLKPEA